MKGNGERQHSQINTAFKLCQELNRWIKDPFLHSLSKALLSMILNPCLCQDMAWKAQQLKQCASSVLRHTLLLVIQDSPSLLSLSSCLCTSVPTCFHALFPPIHFQTLYLSHLPLYFPPMFPSPLSFPITGTAYMPAFSGPCTVHAHDRRQALAQVFALFLRAKPLFLHWVSLTLSLC